MKFSLNFLKEFVDIKVSAERLAQLLTMAGLEVASKEQVGKDISFDVEVTSNRPDLLSIAGIGYEAAALLGVKSRIPLTRPKKAGLLKMPIAVEKKQDCPLYVARVIEGLKVGPSPSWLVERLKACGIVSINNIVDITNYCMLKWGQPLHAFDLDKLEGGVMVRRAKPKERIVCIDNKERELQAEALVIADAKGPIALAGVIGGKESEVSASTSRILLEAAIFSPLRVRRTRRLLGLNTDSSYRFERQVNPVYIEQASSEAAKLIEELAKGILSGYKKVGAFSLAKRPKIKFEPEDMNQVLGTDIKQAQAVKILKGLGFKVDKKRKDIFVTPPVFRQDISIKQDLFEEVARIWGYQNIEDGLPLVKKDMAAHPSFYRLKEAMRDKVIRLGFKEIVTLSIVSEKLLNSHLLKDVVPLRVVNPLRQEEDVLRPFVFLGMLERLRYNVYRKQPELKLFEIADSFLRDKDSFKEDAKLCLGWHAQRKEDFYLFKGKVEAFLKASGIVDFKIVEQENRLFSNFCLIDDLGWIGILSCEKAKALDLASVFLGEFDLGILKRRLKPAKFRKINYFPWVERDVSMAVRSDIGFKDIEDIITVKAGSLLKQIDVCDIYKGEKIPKDFIGFTLRIFYQHQDRTLEAKEVDDLHFSLRDVLAGKEGVILR